MSVLVTKSPVTTGEWMISTPGTPGSTLQHLIQPGAETRPYALTYAYVAPCVGHPLCIPADARYRSGIPQCSQCAGRMR